MSLVLANTLLLVLVLVEVMVLLFVKKQEVHWRDVIFNLNSGHILMWVLRGLEISAFYFVSTYWSFPVVAGWPYWLVWVFTFLAWDFCFYWLHRLHHKYRFLWAVHVVHHEGAHFNLSLGIRNSWYSSLTSFPFFILLALIGVPVEVFIATSSIHYFIQFYNHNGIVNKSGFLEKIMITPSHHRVHHGMNDQYIDRNFGGTLVIWDKLFGTFQSEMEAEPVIFGVKDYVKNYNVIWANNFPFLKLFGLKKAIGQPEDKIHYSVPEYVIAVGGVLLFLPLLYYISIENSTSLNTQLVLFTLTFLGTIAIGGVSENRKWGFWLWCIIFWFLAPIYLFHFKINEPICLIIFSLLFLQGVLMLVKIKKL